MTRLARLFVLSLLLLLPTLCNAQEATAASPPENLAERTLEVANRQVFEFRATMFDASPEERAQRARDRIASLSREDLLATVYAQPVSLGNKQGVVMVLKAQPLFVVYQDDLDPVENPPLAEEAKRVQQRLTDALRARHEQLSAHRLAIGTALAAGATLGYLAMALLFARGQRRLLARVIWQLRERQRGKLSWHWLLLTVERYGVMLAHLFAQLAFAYLWLAFVLQQFPYTRLWGLKLGQSLINLLLEFTSDILDATPGLITIALILLLTRLAVHGLDFVFTAVESGRLTLPGLHPDTIGATRRLLVVVLWLFALIIAYPYLPGSHSDAFKGVSVFFGLMLTLGSAGIVNQTMSGLVLVYSRALKPGDWVHVGDAEGQVIALGALSTKLVNRLKQEITLPNSVVVGGKIVNSTRLTNDTGIPFTTKLTIGYDTPWRQVQAMLELAARRTAGVRSEPPAQVNQLSLQDFYIEYELVVRLADSMVRNEVLTELHSHILDVFNEFGVQIMSPHYMAQPQQDVVVPPAQWSPPPAKPTQDL
ncbi:mechanosensitive ion channel [Crenobacter sp. SG2305]|uniref:mechanosensitive ion channel family protein n=1 Tax=Crenobacter oryzisoli TaxID=3056844 RepID=UPI0025AA6BB1|nr:mechanosensitive ion channel domain-containing protein [Crenobacter sp. SG2305]MDN0083104.1 mechanosensitive ion channel [Crenobacter sp. SG2305]